MKSAGEETFGLPVSQKMQVGSVKIKKEDPMKIWPFLTEWNWGISKIHPYLCVYIYTHGQSVYF